MKTKTLTLVVLAVVLIAALVAVVKFKDYSPNYNFSGQVVEFDTFSQYRGIYFPPIQYIKGDGKEQYVIRTQVEWEDFRASLTHGLDWSWPQIDFETEMLIIVYAGWFPSGGFSVDVVDVREEDEKLHVYTQLTTPGNCTTTDVETHPAHLIKLQTTDVDVIFVELEEKVIRC